ncbi:MAG: DUF1707 SHOCT-like domain-containing protein [Streptosporangiaceae bacterium]
MRYTSSGDHGIDRRPAEPGDNRLTRVGDAERDQAAGTLGEHFAAGRLDQAEFDERLAAAYAARTGADLDRLFTDLPSTAPASTSAPARGPTYPPRWRTAAPLVPVVLVSLLLALAVIGIVRGDVPPFVLFPLLWLWWFRAGPRAGWHHAATRPRGPEDRR